MDRVIDRKPVSIYIHIPFCRRKCRYCDFLSWPNQLENLQDYVNALIKEIDRYRGWLADRLVSTVFFGGGTPSLMNPEQVCRIIHEINQKGHLSGTAEITMEANPDQLTEEKLEGYRDAGVNRLSIGLQSTDPALLSFLGRNHTAHDFYKAVEAARKAGIQNINGDLIFGIPGQTLEQWRSSLEEVVKVQLPHLSCYGLTYEEETPLYRSLIRNEFQPIDEDLEWNMFRHGIQWLQESGYEHYEISNYALPGYQCLHNLTYWENREYIGLGVGAHGFLEGERVENTSSLSDYFQMLERNRFPVINRHKISVTESVSETCFLGLRLRKGISEQRFLERYGKPLLEFYPSIIPQLIERELLVKDKGYLRLTEVGIDLSNQVFEALMLEEKLK